ncbi:MAG: ACP S-malonyltransferase [Acidobacteriota bacterium]|nr:ACP S-malonyltransferase [Acidobacteriota bacterium]MDH3786637.1 ACP S-malonyltransferase [Acidobacteriota bacterium]
MSRIAFLFPGQGAQYPGMGQDLHDGLREAREVFDRADEALGESISRICFHGLEDELALTENTQPAILTCSVAALAGLTSRGVQAAAAAGHSLGEYSAHVAAGTLSFDDAVRTVRQRGRFMQDAVPVGTGAMAALIGLELKQVAAICEDAAGGQVVQPANLNAEKQIVIAGHAEAVERARLAALEAGARKAVPLQVSAPFHCALMEPAALRLEEVLLELPFSTPDVPVYANVLAAPVVAADDARARLVEQVASAVRWHETTQRLIADGFDTLIELGPGRVLTGLAKRVSRDLTLYNVSDMESLDRVAASLREDG